MLFRIFWDESKLGVKDAASIPFVFVFSGIFQKRNLMITYQIGASHLSTDRSFNEIPGL